MSTLIVTASSKSKCETTDKSYYAFGEKTFLDAIDEEFQEQLRTSREYLINDLNIPKGTDLQIERVDTEPETYLPGYIRYTGNTYSKITDEAWKALDSNDDMDMIILSALYGMIRYNEPVRNYTIKQVDKVENSRIKTFWKNNGARDWLTNYILNEGYDEVKFVLSTSYSQIVQRDKMIKELKEDHGIDAVDRQFKSSGMASMFERGSYINDLLLNNIDD